MCESGYVCECECRRCCRGCCEWLWLCDNSFLAAVVITFFGCFSVSRGLRLAVDSCVLFVAAAGCDGEALALEERS